MPGIIIEDEDGEISQHEDEDDDENIPPISTVIFQAIGSLRRNESSIEQAAVFIIQARQDILNFIATTSQDEQDIPIDLFLESPTHNLIPILQMHLNEDIEYENFIDLITVNSLVSHETWLNHLVYLYTHIGIFGTESQIMNMRRIYSPPQTENSLLFSRLALELNIASNGNINFPITGEALTELLPRIVVGQIEIPAQTVEPTEILDTNGNPINEEKISPHDPAR